MSRGRRRAGLIATVATALATVLVAGTPSPGVTPARADERAGARPAGRGDDAAERAADLPEGDPDAGATLLGRPGTPHAVTWDQSSLMIDGKRLVLWSGEVHPFRLPSPGLWRDILQKMRSSGYTAVSIYVDWAYQSSAPGVYDWSGIRNLDAFLRIAEQTGLYVIARPGPYINAEVDGGGFPGWLTTKAGQARTNAPGYLTWSDEYQAQVDAILAAHQVTSGTGTVLLYQIENENSGYVSTAAGKDYMAHLYAKARADGITVPIFHNDKGRNGYWVPGSFATPASENPPNYLYGFDGYPAGTCSSSGNPGTPGAPPDWGSFGIGGAKGGASASPTTPGLLAEFGGGWFDPWGGKLMGGKGYPCMRARQNAAMERQYYLTNIANGIRIQNVYMTYGGTSWGWLPAPLVYTSYDYGAAIDEARTLTSKIAPMKEIGYFLQSVTPMATAAKAPDQPSAPATGVKPYHLVDSTTGTHFYFVRTDSTSAAARFTLPITTGDGSWTIPQSGTIGLDGVDMKVLTAGYDLGATRLAYSTSEIMTHLTDTATGTDTALLYTRDGQDGETLLRYAGATSAPEVTTLTGTAPSLNWDAATGDLRLDYTGNGLTAVKITRPGGRPLVLILAAESVARTFTRLDTTAGPVLVRGPQLVRTASVRGGRLALTGDTTDPAPLEVWTAAGARSVTWNGRGVAATRSADGVLTATSLLPGVPAVTLPELTGWTARDESPESAAGFDDSAWTVADHTTSNSRTAVPAGQPVLFADDYGYHYGDVWYRGHWSESTADAASSGASSAAQVSLTYQTGQSGMLEAWLDGTYLGSHQMSTPTVSQSTVQGWTATAAFAVPDALRAAGDHVLAVLVRTQGHEEDGASNDSFRNARGLLSAGFTDTAGAALTVPVTWRIQGSQGGETAAVPVAGPMNSGGLYGERAGWALPGHPETGGTPVTLPVTVTRPGVTWYHTETDLAVPEGVDASIGLQITDDPAKTYRALLYVNGWNIGQYVNDVGPQSTFVVPNGILDPRGHNRIDLAVTSRETGGLGTVRFTLLGSALGGVRVPQVTGLRYTAPHLDAAGPVVAVAGSTWSGTVARYAARPGTVLDGTVLDGTVLAATVDWGDGTTSAGVVEGGRVSASHVYRDRGVHPVTVTLADAYGPVLDRVRTWAVIRGTVADRP